MKKLALYVLLFVFVFTSTAIAQLTKLPNLIEHFAEHNSKNPSLTFADFLAMHYATSNDNDGDDERDMQLPFKKTTPIATYTFAFTQQDIKFENIAATIPTTALNTMFHYVDFIQDKSAVILIQPPETN
jgi:hypothetical protein